MRLIVCGDSHVKALYRGFGKLRLPKDADFGDINFIKLFVAPDIIRSFFWKDEEQIGFFDKRAAETLQNLYGRPTFAGFCPDTVFAFCMGGTATLTVRLPDWHDHAPVGARLCDLDRRRVSQLVSEGAVKAIASEHQKHVHAFFAAAKALGMRNMAVFAPPIRQDERAIVDLGNPAGIVAEVDRIARAVMKEELDRLGTPVILPPVEACQNTDLGLFLRPEFHNELKEDSHHANAAFGTLMIPQILEEARRMIANPETVAGA